MALMTICKYPGCRKPVPLGAKYCEAHKAAGEARDAKFAADREAPSREKGIVVRSWLLLQVAASSSSDPCCASALC